MKRLCQIVIIFVSISFLTCFGGSKEISKSDGSFKYPQHMVDKLTLFMLDNFQKILIKTVRVSNGLNPDQDRHSVCPDLDPNYLQMTKKQLARRKLIIHSSFVMF